MSNWDPAAIEQVATNDEVRLAVDTRDGSPGDPVIMWTVALDGEVFVRAVRGEQSPWYRRALVVPTGSMRIGSLSSRVTIAHDSTTDADALSDAYQAKYGRYAQNIVDSTKSDIARAATLKLTKTE